MPVLKVLDVNEYTVAFLYWASLDPPVLVCKGQGSHECGELARTVSGT
jgi:hypothetical protein